LKFQGRGRIFRVWWPTDGSGVIQVSQVAVDVS
jgi:hypothetical protein